MEQFTASEVRNAIPCKETRNSAMLRAYADLLEARERTVPVAYAEFADNGCVRMWSRGYEERLPGTRMIPLYTHPAPSDAERLAEALRNLVSEWVAIADDGDATLEDSTIGYRACANRLSAMLAAHSAQAQPPAANVTDEMVERARSAFVQADDGSTGITDAIRAALLAAAPQPPAAEPVAWMHPELHKGHPYPEECLSTEALDGWLPLYTHPQPAQDAKDAARYRWMRGMRNREQATMLVSFKMNLDAAIDAAMAKESGR